MVLKGRVKNGSKFQTSCTESDLRGSWGGDFGCCGIIYVAEDESTAI